MPYTRTPEFSRVVSGHRLLDGYFHDHNRFTIRIKDFEICYRSLVWPESLRCAPISLSKWEGGGWRDRTSLHTVDLDLDIVDVNELIQRVDKVSFMWSFKLQHIIALLDHCFRLNLGGCQAILSINKI